MNLKDVMEEIGSKAKEAAQTLSNVKDEAKNRGLLEISSSLRNRTDDKIEANKKDNKESKEKHLSPAMIDRLNLHTERISSMATGLEEIASFSNPNDIFIVFFMVK